MTRFPKSKEFLILILLFVFVPLCSYGGEKTAKEEIKSAAFVFFRYLQENNYEKLADYIYPQLYDYITREDFIKMMEKISNDTSYIYRFNNFKINSISDIVKDGPIRYSKVNYSFSMDMIFRKSNVYINDETFINMLGEMLEKKFGSSNVKYDSTGKAFVVNIRSDMFAIAKPTYLGWKFIQNDKQIVSFVKKIIPEIVIEQLEKSK